MIEWQEQSIIDGKKITVQKQKQQVDIIVSDEEKIKIDKRAGRFWIDIIAAAKMTVNYTKPSSSSNILWQHEGIIDRKFFKIQHAGNQINIFDEEGNKISISRQDGVFSLIIHGTFEITFNYDKKRKIVRS